MILERRRLVSFLVLVALVIAAVFFIVQNWRHAAAGAPANATLVSVGTRLGSAPASGPARAAGAPTTRSGGAQSAADYFAAAHLQRDQAESRELSDLRTLATDSATTAGVRAQAQEQILQLEQMQQEEAASELVLQAKGYPSSLVLLRPGGATVVVQAASFTAADAALVAQAVAGAAGLDPADVQIVPRGA